MPGTDKTGIVSDCCFNACQSNPSLLISAMTATSLAVIGVTILFSSFISGLFGMAGGMVLLGVLLVYFDVATGMVLFSIIQFFVNGSRVVQWREHVIWPIFYWYLLGATAAFTVMWKIAFVPNKGTVYLLIGLMPFVIDALPAAMRPNIEWRRIPIVTGFLTTIVQILSGVGGLMLDIFFQKSRLDRKATNATKAVAQTFSHVLRWLYFGSIAGIAGVSIWMVGSAVALGMVGAALAPYVLERMTDDSFRQWTRTIIYVISIVYVVHGGYLLWVGE